jgi:hypothetical protein
LRRSTELAFDERGTARIARAEARRGQDAFDLAAQRKLRRVLLAVEKHGEFQAR